MRQSRNRLLIERFYLEMWNRFDKSVISEILTEDLRFRGSLGQSKNGYSEFGEYVDFVQRAFPDFSNEIEEIICEGDKALAKLLYRGTHRGEIFGITPTRRPVRYAGAAVFKFRGDRTDVHKRTISYCVKDGSGKSTPRARFPLDVLISSIPLVVAVPWYGRLLLRPQLRVM